MSFSLLDGVWKLQSKISRAMFCLSSICKNTKYFPQWPAHQVETNNPKYNAEPHYLWSIGWLLELNTIPGHSNSQSIQLSPKYVCIIDTKMQLNNSTSSVPDGQFTSNCTTHPKWTYLLILNQACWFQFVETFCQLIGDIWLKVVFKYLTINKSFNSWGAYNIHDDTCDQNYCNQNNPYKNFHDQIYDGWVWLTQTNLIFLDIL